MSRRDRAHRAAGDTDRSADRLLADLLGVGVEQLVEVLGADWRAVAGPDEGCERWFVTGEPAQLAVGFDVLAPASLVLARPAPRWNDLAAPDWHVDERRSFGVEALALDPAAVSGAAADIVGRRRRSFRWCRSCRRLEAPEWFMPDIGCCMRCASAHHGVVF